MVYCQMNVFIPFGIIIASLHSDINDIYTFTYCSCFLVLD